MEAASWWVLLWPGPALALAGALLALLVARFIVPRLPEPQTDPDDPFVKPLYSSLVRPGVVLPAMAFGAAGGLLSALAGGLVAAAVVLAGVGGALVSVDLATTYLPARLHWACSVLMAVAGVTGVMLLEPSDRWPMMALGSGFGLVAAHAVFWLLWRLGDGFGYGDVRLAALIGAFSGALGVQPWWTTLVAGTMVGAVAAIVVGLWRRRHPHPLGTAFPYGPALWAGPFLALVLLHP